jgi:hypothetical protein
MNQVENPKTEEKIQLRNLDQYGDIVHLNKNVEVNVNIENWIITIEDKKTKRKVVISPWNHNDDTNERECVIELQQNDRIIDQVTRSTEV